MRNGKISIFIEQKLNENEVANFVENTSKFAKILNENERILSVHFREFENFDGNPSLRVGVKELSLELKFSNRGLWSFI